MASMPKPGAPLSYIPGMTSAPFRPECFGSGPRSAGVTGAEGSLDAELAETILAESGMKGFRFLA
jgi:hypothetical protein